RLKQTLSEQLKENESLMQIVTLLKNDFKKEESREIALEKKIKHLDNIVYKRDQSAQTVHMLTKPQFLYDHTTKQALGFQNHFYLKKAQQLEPKLYDSNVIKNTCAIMILDSEETLMLTEVSRSEMILKQQDPMVLENKVNTKPFDYASLNQLSQDFEKQFVPQTELFAEQSFWSQKSLNSSDPRVKSSTSANRSQPSTNIKKDKIQRPPSGTQKNKVEAQLRIVESSLKNKNCVVEPKGTASVQRSKLNANPDIICVKITSTTEVPSRKSIALATYTPVPVVIVVYSRKSRRSKTIDPVTKSKVIKSVYANKKEPNKSWGSTVSNIPSSSIDECRNDHVAKIMGYGHYQIGNVTISRVYYVEGLGHNLFSAGQFCDSNLEVAFRQHACFIYNLEGVDLLTGSRGNNMYTLSLGDTMASSLICLLLKASKTKSWLWHRHLSHLNFGAINHLARHGLVR
nr:integrase, catalytic region, zinc finger, CCHC-type, peptidase aspartic, catalytic [Tanacetum cinerariifolium]